MKTATAEKVALLRKHLTAYPMAFIRVAGSRAEYAVTDVRQRTNNLEFLLAGEVTQVLIVAPDELGVIRLVDL